MIERMETDWDTLLGSCDAEPLALWHGSVTGLLCGAPDRVAIPMVRALELPDGSTPDDGDAGEGGAPAFADSMFAADLERVVAATRHWLEEGGSDFQPLLSDGTALSERALALGQWCQGFLYGLANTTRRDLLEAGALAEVLGDFAEISRAVRGGEEAEEAEGAYAELLEFVRVGVLLCFEELRAERERWPGPADLPDGDGDARTGDSLQ
jgi:uncharacterized protein YgfB (UPF0149 family)